MFFPVEAKTAEDTAQVGGTTEFAPTDTVEEEHHQRIKLKELEKIGKGAFIFPNLWNWLCYLKFIN